MRHILIVSHRMSHMWYRRAWVMCGRLVDSFNIRVTWMNHMWINKKWCHVNETYTYCVLWNKSDVNESWHIWMSHVTYEWVMSRMNEPCHVWMSHATSKWVMSRMNESCHIWMSHVTYEWVMSRMNESCHIWMRLSYKIWVIRSRWRSDLKCLDLEIY